MINKGLGEGLSQKGTGDHLSHDGVTVRRDVSYPGVGEAFPIPKVHRWDRHPVDWLCRSKEGAKRNK